VLDDLRFFLAVARTGSTLAGAKALKVSQTTAARRVAALEEALGLQLFERRQAGYVLTPRARRWWRRRRKWSEPRGLSRGRGGAGARGERDVRLTTVEVYATTLLPPLLKALREAHPRIRIELDTTEVPRDLAAGEADVALRGGAPVNAPGLVGRRIAPDPWTLYCSRAYADATACPPRPTNLRGTRSSAAAAIMCGRSTASGCSATGWRRRW
jgi:DNA-binding transcriptional LysR family regulator